MAARGITVMGGVIDSGYRGEWKVVLLNTAVGDYTLQAGDKVVQVIFIPCFHLKLTPVSKLEESIRGVGGFGSTGK
jgi:dUTP pyrophosphatase